MLSLYYVDDERGMKKFIKGYLGILNKDQDRVNYDNMYCGEGAVDAFFNEIDSLSNNKLNECIFLLDVRMPVPKELNNADVWGNYKSAKSDVCGFALAKYLIDKNFDINRIRLFSAYKDIIDEEFKKILEDKEKDIFFSKYDLNVEFFEKWLESLGY